MVITLKIISCAVNYNDGLLKEEGLREAQKKNRLLKLPSFLEYVGYCLCCGSHFAGPVYEMKDYLDWTGNTGVCFHVHNATCMFCHFCTAVNSGFILLWVDLETYREGIVPLSLWSNDKGSSASCSMYGPLSVSCTTFSIFPIYGTSIPRIWILEAVRLPIHDRLHCSLEVLFYLVDLGSFYYYFWVGI